MVIQCSTIIMKGVVFVTISVRLNDKDIELIKAYAEMNGMTLSELVRKSILEKIEDEYDLKCYYEAMEEYKKNYYKKM